MTVNLSALHDGQQVTIGLHEVTGLDALVYRKATGEELDSRLGLMIAAAPDDPDGWSLADRAVIVWLWTRHNVNPDAPLAVVAAGVTLIPAPASAGDVDAPGDES